jgi:hypothetical protein
VESVGETSPDGKFMTFLLRKRERDARDMPRNRFFYQIRGVSLKTKHQTTDEMKRRNFLKTTGYAAVAANLINAKGWADESTVNCPLCYDFPAENWEHTDTWESLLRGQVRDYDGPTAEVEQHGTTVGFSSWGSLDRDSGYGDCGVKVVQIGCEVRISRAPWQDGQGLKKNTDPTAGWGNLEVSDGSAFVTMSASSIAEVTCDAGTISIEWDNEVQQTTVAEVDAGVQFLTPQHPHGRVVNRFSLACQNGTCNLTELLTVEDLGSLQEIRDRETSTIQPSEIVRASSPVSQNLLGNFYCCS